MRDTYISTVFVSFYVWSDHDITFDSRSLTVTTELIPIHYQARELRWSSLSFVRRRWKKKLASGKKLFNLSDWFTIRALIPRSDFLVFQCFTVASSWSVRFCGLFSLLFFLFPCSPPVLSVVLFELFPLFVWPFLFVRAFPLSCGFYRSVTHCREFWQRINFLPFSDR